MRAPFLLVALWLAASLTPAGLHAQAKPAPRMEITADLGFVSTSGNTDITTLSANETVVLNSGAWKLTHYFGTVYGKIKDSVNTSIWRTGLRGDRALTEPFGAFLLLNYDKNRFAGIAGRWEQGVGVQWKALATDEDKLDVEVGISAIQQQAIAPAADRTFASGRSALIYKHNVTDKSYFQQNVEYLTNLQNGPDWRVNTESAIIAPLSQQLAIKVSYLIRYQNLPDPGFRATDRIFATGIQFTY